MSSLITLTDAAAAVQASSVSSRELTLECLDKISTARLLGAFVYESRDAALDAADSADADTAAGRERGVLHGVPLAVKDVFATRDAPTTANSRALEPNWGGGDDARAVANLRAAGAVLLGKTSTHEFACGPPDSSTSFPIPRNPWHEAHTPDGSSSGSCIAVAAGLAWGALGTDSGGSLRAPAAANGVTGLKPTFGLVSRAGVIPLSDSLDTVGPVARSAADCALLLTAMTGRRVQPLRGVAGLRLGMLSSGYFGSEALDPHALAAVESFAAVLRDAGAETARVEVAGGELATSAAVLIIACEAFGHHRNRLRARWSDYGEQTRRFLASGAFVSAADYLAAQRFRSAFRRQLADVFGRFDLLLTPSSAAPAARLDQEPDLEAEEPNLDAPWNLAGLPAAAVPCGFTPDGMPLSVQVVGRPHADYDVLAVADAFQKRTDWHRKAPPGWWIRPD